MSNPIIDEMGYCCFSDKTIINMSIERSLNNLYKFLYSRISIDDEELKFYIIDYLENKKLEKD